MSTDYAREVPDAQSHLHRHNLAEFQRLWRGGSTVIPEHEIEDEELFEAAAKSARSLITETVRYTLEKVSGIVERRIREEMSQESPACDHAATALVIVSGELRRLSIELAGEPNVG
jgi:hypothetical protein